MATLLLSVALAPATRAQGSNAIRNVAGFNANQLPPNDDGSTPGRVPLGFTANFFGTNYDSVFVNNNGNITFDRALPNYTPFGLTATRTVIVANFFADIDTRVANTVKYGTGTVDGRAAFGVNSIGVGYFREHADKLNDLQLILIDRSDTGPGNFDIEFNYNRVQWETGDASGGRGGIGGTPVRIGYSNGTGAPGTSFELPGSGVSGAFLDSNPSTALIRRSLNSNEPGRYMFFVRNGTVIPPEPMRPVPTPRQEPAKPAFVTVVQRPSPNLTTDRSTVDYGVSSVYRPKATDDGIVTYDIEVVNRGEGNATGVVIRMPLDPAEARVLDAKFSRTDAFVSSVVTNALEIRTGGLGPNGDVITATVRLLTRPSAPLNASLGERLTYQWTDAREGGSGRSNLPVLVVANSDNNQPVYPVAASPASGAAGSVSTFSPTIFKPDEPVAFWYHTPDGRDVGLPATTANAEGTANVTFNTTGLVPGTYLIVGRGAWTTFTAAARFDLR
jgi:hypothetical protein